MPIKPNNYGRWWDENGHGTDWYRYMHDCRQSVHAAFLSWVASVETADGRLASVLEVGCGRGVVYPAAFAGRKYVGYDCSPKEIAWCRENCTAEGRSFSCGDFIVPTERPQGKYDLVFSHAVIDHVYDVDAFVAACVASSSRWVYLTAYMGWFPSLPEHLYSWTPEATCYHNCVSSRRLLAQLQALGCTSVRVEPLPTGAAHIPQETVIVARVN